ncbi:hypothetical protein [Roseibium sp. RKSG952]|uniref:hypothetical protein n=1 Tax=Roseibium sp. RKSG952 TaxID=2529384 RepID=UPI0012BBFA78|nr:hypothetical protein [Roseibium sp. RKSG952]MTI01950.1 hypothetical protein [Roseibium sp. RKSG952]
MMNTVTSLMAESPEHLSPIGAGVLVAAHFGVSSDSRSFASKLGVAHALVLRECVTLAEEHQLISLENREERSQRLFYSLTAQGHDLLAKVH